MKIKVTHRRRSTVIPVINLRLQTIELIRKEILTV